MQRKPTTTVTVVNVVNVAGIRWRISTQVGSDGGRDSRGQPISPTLKCEPRRMICVREMARSQLLARCVGTDILFMLRCHPVCPPKAQKQKIQNELR